MKKIAYDSMKLDQLQIVEDSKCCLKVNAVITKEGVYDYPDGKAFKSRMELLKAANAIRYAGAKIVAFDHPDSMVVMSQQQIQGGIEKPFFDRNKIRAVLNFDKNRCKQDFLDKIRSGQLKDVSIGFYYSPDLTPGRWNGRNYDYVMRDIVIDHVAAGVLRGRCSYPSCGIGVDTVLRRISIGEDKVVKRGSQWCVVHCHPDGSIGKVIKCFPTASQAEAMHRAIQAQQHGASSLNQGNANNMKTTYEQYFAGVDQDKRPPKDWWNNCTSKAESFASDPNRFCNWLWYEAGEPMKSSFGRASKSTKGGMNENMSLEEMYYPERSKEFNDCVKQRMADGMPREQAEAQCGAATKPEDEPKPFEKLDQEELSEWQKCIKEQMADGKTMEEATEACKTKGITKGDQDAAFENCVERKMEDEGLERAEAEKQCRVEHPVGEGDQEAEKTPMERCVEEQMEQGKPEAEAKEWCEAHLAGEHESADSMEQRANKLLELKRQSDAEKRKERIRNL